MLQTRSLQSAPRKADGLRLLVARFRGRGVPASAYDVWLPNLGPSEELLRAFLDGGIPWREFERRYTHELFEPGQRDARNRTVKDHGQKFVLRLVKHLAEGRTVTLLCHCAEDQAQCHRHVLKRVLESRKV